MGVISLCADITYEGARSITGPYLSILGASAGLVGLITGFGEFAGFLLRLPFGYLADRTKAYWWLTIIGYGMILAIPLLAFAGHWQIAALLIIIERVGKAIRSPARDTILSYATKQVGRGMGFGIHEAMDQIGAVIGPLVFSGIFLFKGSYQQGFTLLWIPAVLVLGILFFAKTRVSSPQELESDAAVQQDVQKTLPRTFWVYTLFIFVSVCGFASFPLISFHLKTKAIFSDTAIPLLYAAAMAIDAVVALIIGKMYDRIGLRTLFAIPLLTLFIPFLAFSYNKGLVIASVLLWGSAMGVHETIMRAAIADLAPLQKRGAAYGIFNTAYGLAFFLGSAAMGFLYEAKIAYLVFFAVGMQVFSLAVFSLLWKQTRSVA